MGFLKYLRLTGFIISSGMAFTARANSIDQMDDIEVIQNASQFGIIWTQDLQTEVNLDDDVIAVIRYALKSKHKLNKPLVKILPDGAVEVDLNEVQKLLLAGQATYTSQID